MKTLKAFALLFVLTALPVSAELGPDGTGVVKGYQIGPDADLSGAQLRDAYLRGANLRNADLSDADLSGANLSDAELSGAVLTGVIRPDPILDPRIAELEAQLAAANAARNTAITERDTANAALNTAITERNTAIAERDARPTLAEVQDARVGSIVLAKDGQTDEVSLCFGLQQTDDFVSWTAFEGGTWSDAPNGEFKLALPLGEAKKWLRLTLPE